jgi:hypothetical protein
MKKDKALHRINKICNKEWEKINMLSESRRKYEDKKRKIQIVLAWLFLCVAVAIVIISKFILK